MKNKLIISSLALAALLTSCRDENKLYPENPTSFLDNQVFATASRIQSQLLGVYGSFKHGNQHGGRYIIYNDIRGEDILSQTSNLVTAADIFAQNPTNSSNSITNFWTQSYYTINNVNLFIEGMDTQGKAVVGDALYKNYVAEVKVIRALSYYGLLQFFAKPYADGAGSKPGLPLRLTAVKGAGSSQLARSTVGEVYAQILKDLNEAEADLPLNYSGTSNVTRIHRNTAIALKTRVYLSMQKYTEAVTEANKIVSAAAPFTATSGVANRLEPNIANVFSSYTTAESIFSLPMTATAGDFPGTQNQIAYYWTPATGGGVGNGEYSLNPAGILANTTQFTAADKRREFVLSTGSGSSARLWNMKFKAPSPYTDWVPVIRYAEVLLNLAEAKVRASNAVDAQAIALLNAVHGRSDAAKVFTAADFPTAADFLTAVDNERRMEFMGEGHRTRDITRLLKPFPAHGGAPAKALNDVGYIWPIPAAELSLNPAMTDN